MCKRMNTQNQLLDLLSHLLTLITSMYKGLTMRAFVVSGKKAVRYSHLEETQTGWDSVSALTGIYLGDGVIRVASS
ncbi:hypothetical protein CRYUN_Cryun30bG0084500 [Craigia yunnanensis]